MPSKSPLARFEAVLKGRDSSAKKAAQITALSPRLPEAALPMMDVYLDAASPLVKVAIMDAYFEMTDDDYHEADLIAILDAAKKAGDAGEETYMAARMALSRIYQRPGVRDDPWGIGDLEVLGIKTRVAGRPARALGLARPRRNERITIIIHGTWAADGKWWRPGGDFFEYTKRDLQRADLYGKPDLYKWSGKNRDSSRRKAATSLRGWLASHPAAEVSVFAHSHGANVAMLATHNGVKIDRLVMLSPPVRSDYFANWSNVGKAFNIQASFDPVVAIARGGQWFRDHGVIEKKMNASGHSSSHEPDVWKKERLAKFVGVPW